MDKIHLSLVISLHCDWDKRSSPTNLTPAVPSALQVSASTGPEAGDAAFGVIRRGGFYHTRLRRKLAQLLTTLKGLLLEFAMLVPVKY